MSDLHVANSRISRTAFRAADSENRYAGQATAIMGAVAAEVEIQVAMAMTPLFDSSRFQAIPSASISFNSFLIRAEITRLRRCGVRLSANFPSALLAGLLSIRGSSPAKRRRNFRFP